jgi:uncharacterized membrane-anchored protein YhcB (DUF1043 family)
MDWTISIVTFIIGSLLGYFICRIQLNGGSGSNEQQAKNEQLQTELNQYKQDVEQHFAGSAELLNKMATDYSKIYQHMAQSQQTLLPDSEPAISPLFIEDKESSVTTQGVNESESPADETTAAKEDEPTANHQPNDYVDGSHGIINSPKMEPQAAVKS